LEIRSRHKGMSHLNGADGGGTKSQPAALRESLMQLVNRVTRDAALRQDLMQEALLHLWLIETKRPGQTLSWYLQSCRFHLQHYLASGKSVDSGKRREGKLQFAFDSETGEGVPEQSDSGNSVITSVSARELIFLLSRQLRPQEKAVLDCLADGWGAREIGRKLKISHTMVIRYRRRIATLLKRLESPHEFFDREKDNGNGHLRSSPLARAKKAFVPGKANDINGNRSTHAGRDPHSQGVRASGPGSISHTLVTATRESN
jgi:DNA-directed RNA polymerase specialized sigma24 family protein